MEFPTVESLLIIIPYLTVMALIARKRNSWNRKRDVIDRHYALYEKYRLVKRLTR